MEVTVTVMLLPNGSANTPSKYNPLSRPLYFIHKFQNIEIPMNSFQMFLVEKIFLLRHHN